MMCLGGPRSVMFLGGLGEATVDAVMVVVESASNVGRQQRYWEMTAGIGAGSRIIQRPWSGLFDGLVLDQMEAGFLRGMSPLQ